MLARLTNCMEKAGITGIAGAKDIVGVKLALRREGLHRLLEGHLRQNGRRDDGDDRVLGLPDRRQHALRRVALGQRPPSADRLRARLLLRLDGSAGNNRGRPEGHQLRDRQDQGQALRVGQDCRRHRAGRRPGDAHPRQGPRAHRPGRGPQEHGYGLRQPGRQAGDALRCPALRRRQVRRLRHLPRLVPGRAR